MDLSFDPSLVLHLPLYEQDGASFMSKDAYGHLCTVTGALWAPQGRTFDGIDDYISFQNVEARTQGGWFYLTQSASSKGDMNYLFNNFYQHYANNFLYFDTPWGGLSYFQVTPSVSIWHHVVVTYPTPGYCIDAVLYLDGIIYNISQSGSPNRIFPPCEIGCSTANQTWTGIVGDVWFYNRVLTALEIRNNYLATKWKYT